MQLARKRGWVSQVDYIISLRPCRNLVLLRRAKGQKKATVINKHCYDKFLRRNDKADS